MKRKIIQLAGSTLVVSLPSKWAEEQHLKKGLEVEAIPKGSDLLIRTSGGPEEKKTVLDSKDMSERVFRWTLSSLHKQGYDEIDIIYNDKKLLSWCEDMIKNLLLGFVIISHTEKHVIVRRMSQDILSELDSSLRRAFLVTINMGEEIASAIQAKDHSRCKELISLEKTNNQLTNFCERLINKHMPEHSIMLYVIIWNLEKICDDLKYVCQTILVHEKPRLTNDVPELLQKAVAYLRDYLSLYGNFSFASLEKIYHERHALLAQREKYFAKKSPEEILILHHLFSFIEKIDDFSAVTIGLKQGA
jgi:phosphate uptake regulator